jgi:serine/threonine protein kinase
MEKQKDILLLFLLKNFCENNGIEDKYTIIKQKLEKEKLLEKGLEELTLVQTNKLIEYLPIEKTSKYSGNINFYENIGSGSFGNVFKCFHKIDKNDYAIKIVPIYNDVNSQKYINEVEMMASLDHPNIVRYYNSWIEDFLPTCSNLPTDLYLDEEYGSSCSDIVESYEITKFLFIQMELCHENLNTYLEKRTAVNYLDSKSIFKNILEGLSYLHKMNIIHRDIKPSNIMFDKNGIAKIGDFGMSIKYEEEDSLQKKIVKTENEYGTYNYLAPETIENKEYSVYSDIYSLGIILFELLSTFDTYMEKQDKINKFKNDTIDEEFSSLYPKEIEIIKQLTDKDKFQRLSCISILKKIE